MEQVAVLPSGVATLRGCAATAHTKYQYKSCRGMIFYTPAEGGVVGVASTLAVYLYGVADAASTASASASGSGGPLRRILSLPAAARGDVSMTAGKAATGGVICGIDCDGFAVVAVTSTGRAILWRLGTGQLLSNIVLPPSPGSELPAFTPSCVTALPQALRTIVVPAHGDAMQVRVWSYEKGRVASHNLAQTADYEHITCCVRCPHSAGQSWATVGTTNGAVYIYDTAADRVLRGLALHRSMRDNLLKAASVAAATDPDDDDYGPNNIMCIADLAFDPLGAQHLLVAFAIGPVCLIDIGNGTVAKWFDRAQETRSSVLGVAWNGAAPGAFLSVDGRTNALRLWHVASPVCTGNERVTAGDPHARNTTATMRGASGVGHMNALVWVGQLPGAASNTQLVALATSSGSVVVWDLLTHRAPLVTFPGHADTIFDCRISRSNPNTVVSASFDRTVKAYDLRTLSNTCTLQLDGTGYCVAMHPREKDLIAVGTGTGEVCMYNLATTQRVWSAKAHKGACWKVTFSSDGAYVATSGVDGVVTALHHDTGKIYRTFVLPQPPFALDFSPTQPQMLAVACHDNTVKLYDLAANTTGTSTTGKEYRMLTAHTDSVYGLAWSPTVDHLLATCSDDTTVRVWRLDSRTSENDHTVFTGHTSKVRTVCWCPLAPHILLSGGWDGVVRVWDVRCASGAAGAIACGRGHLADIYAISTHPQRPLHFLTASRDTTVRIWKLRLCDHAHQLAAMGVLHTIIKTPKAIFEAQNLSATREWIGGQGVTDLQTAVAGTNAAAVRMRLVEEFFSLTAGALDFVDCCRFAAGELRPESFHAERRGALVAPVDATTEAAADEAAAAARKLLASPVAAVGSSRRTAKLQSAAQDQLRLGNVHLYCELMAGAGEWTAALAAAPAVSVTYWRSLCHKRGKQLASTGDTAAAVNMFVLACDAFSAAELLSSEGDFGAAVHLLGRVPQLVQRGDEDLADLSATGTQGSITVDGNVAATATTQANVDACVRREVVRVLASFAVASGIAVELAAATFCSVRNFRDAVSLLIAGRSIALAHQAAYVLRLPRESLDAAFTASAYRCARLEQWMSGAQAASLLTEDDAALRENRRQVFAAYIVLMSATQRLSSAADSSASARHQALTAVVAMYKGRRGTTPDDHARATQAALAHVEPATPAGTPLHEAVVAALQHYFGLLEEVVSTPSDADSVRINVVAEGQVLLRHVLAIMQAVVVAPSSDTAVAPRVFWALRAAASLLPFPSTHARIAAYLVGGVLAVSNGFVSVAVCLFAAARATVDAATFDAYDDEAPALRATWDAVAEGIEAVMHLAWDQPWSTDGRSGFDRMVLDSPLCKALRAALTGNAHGTRSPSPLRSRSPLNDAADATGTVAVCETDESATALRLFGASAAFAPSAAAMCGGSAELRRLIAEASPTKLNAQDAAEAHYVLGAARSDVGDVGPSRFVQLGTRADGSPKEMAVIEARQWFLCCAIGPHGAHFAPF